MNDKAYMALLLRRRFRRRLLLISLTFVLSFYVSIYIFGDILATKIMHITDLDKCPACYGISICPELYSGKIFVERYKGISDVFNAKNIFHGVTKAGKRVVLKKLAHNWEFKKFDNSLCETWNLSPDCKPKQLVNVTNIQEKILSLVQYNITHSEITARKGLVVCPYSSSVLDLIKNNFITKTGHHNWDMLNIWTMLSLNPEPIILQMIPKSKFWPVPGFGGVCGRLEVVEYAGQPLTNLMYVDWGRKLNYASAILEAAMDFTFKHERYRFYLMDWALDNIVINEIDELTFVDLEDFVIVDKLIKPGKDLPDWYTTHNREDIPEFVFSIADMCKHHLSDHNIWGACYILAGDDNPLLLPIPEDVQKSRPYFARLLKSCVRGDKKFDTVRILRKVIKEMIEE